jgi:hypothetical protein
MNMAFTMACPNFKKGLKMAFGPLGVKDTESKSVHKKVKVSMELYLKCVTI